MTELETSSSPRRRLKTTTPVAHSRALESAPDQKHKSGEDALLKIWLCEETLEFIEEFVDGAPDASGRSKSANYLAYQLRAAIARAKGGSQALTVVPESSPEKHEVIMSRGADRYHFRQFASGRDREHTHFALYENGAITGFGALSMAAALEKIAQLFDEGWNLERLSPEVAAQ